MFVYRLGVALFCSSLLTGGCKKEETSGDEAKPGAAQKSGDGEAESKIKPGPAAGREIKKPAAPASCMSVLMTEAVPDAKVELEMSIDGKKLPLSFDAAAVYEKNPIWNAGRMPAVCAAITKPRDGGEAGLTWVSQHHVKGQPLLRMQLLGAGFAGTAKTNAGTLTGMVLVEGSDDPYALSFNRETKLEIKSASGKPEPGSVTVTIEGEGKAIGRGDQKPFKLRAAMSGTIKAQNVPGR